MEAMNENLRKQFLTIRNLIINNLKSIRTLLEQAKQLEELVNQLSGKNEDKEKKQQLEDIIQKIYGSIENLITQTDSLFKEYTDIIKSTLNN